MFGKRYVGKRYVAPLDGFSRDAAKLLKSDNKGGKGSETIES